MAGTILEGLYGYGYIAVKLAAGLSLFILILRTTGRGNLNQMTPTDLISNFVMGGIIGGVIYNPNIALYELLIVLIIWQMLMIGINILRRHSTTFHRLVAGGNVALVVNGKFRQAEIKRLNIDLGDFVTMLRIKGCAIHEAAFVRLESNGDLSVIKKQDYKKSTIVIRSGFMVTEGFQEIRKGERWLKAELKKRDLKIEDVFLAEWYEIVQDDKKKTALFVVPFDKPNESK